MKKKKLLEKCNEFKNFGNSGYYEKWWKWFDRDWVRNLVFKLQKTIKGTCILGCNMVIVKSKL